MRAKFRYDPTVDAAYLTLRRKSVAGILLTQSAGNGIYVDLDENGVVVGVEFLDASYHFGPTALAALRRHTDKHYGRRTKQKPITLKPVP